MDHVLSVYEAIDLAGKFAMTFEEYPPRSIPPGFSAYTNMEDVLDGIKRKAELQKFEEMKKVKEATPTTKKN